MTFDPESLTIPQLLQYYAQILEELKCRKVVRTFNNPCGDYAEWLIANKLNLTLTKNSKSDYDAFDSENKYQIKSRRITRHTSGSGRQLSAIRNLGNCEFDYLIAVIFNELFEVEQVIKMPHEIINKYAKYRSHVNAHILILNDKILRDPKIMNITSLFYD